MNLQAALTISLIASLGLGVAFAVAAGVVRATMSSEVFATLKEHLVALLKTMFSAFTAVFLLFLVLFSVVDICSHFIRIVIRGAL